MGVSYPTGTLVRTGAERATLVRRTYSLVFVSVLVTIVGATFALSQPKLMPAVAASILSSHSSALLRRCSWRCGQRPHSRRTSGWYCCSTFVIGVFISPILYIYGRGQPGLITQAAMLTIGAFGVLTLYAFVSRRDFSAWGSFFMVGLWVLIGTMVLNFFFRKPAIDLWLAR